MNPIPILLHLNLEINLGCPRIGMGIPKLIYSNLGPNMVGPQIGMNPILILGLPDLEINSGSPRIGMGIAFLAFFSVMHNISFS